MLRVFLLSFVLMSNLVSGFTPSLQAQQLRSSHHKQLSSSRPRPRLPALSMLEERPTRRPPPAPGSETLTNEGRQSSFRSADPVLEHQDLQLLQQMVPLKPIPSSNVGIGLKAFFIRLRTEAMPWVVTAALAAITSMLAGSIVPAVLIFLFELAFFVFTTIEAQRMNKPPVPEPVSRDLGELWELSLKSAEEAENGIEEFLSGWFYQQPTENIRLEDIRDFITWATFSTTYDVLSPATSAGVDEVVALLEEKLGRKFKPREEGELPVPSMRFTLEPMEYVHKPSIFYFATTFVLGSLGRYQLFKAGFTRHKSGVFKYWARIPVSDAGKKRLPIVFFHGIGVGLVMYLSFIQRLMVNDCPILCIELPFIATKVGKAPPSIDQQLSSMTTILNRWEMDKALFMGHSYGSVMLSWMVQHAPSRVAGIAFIDPVVILLNFKDVLYNFLYRREQEGKISDLVGSELYVNFALRRNFWWYRNIIWAQDLQKAEVPALVCLSEKDEIAPSAAVENHIRKHTEEVGKEASVVRSFVLKDASHGQMLFDSSLASRLASRLSDFYEVCDDKVAVRKPLREPRTLKNLFGMKWVITQGRWRLRNIGRPLAQFLAARGVGVSFGW